ncbi:MAG: AI-2E family transporter [Planctomycetes bacterium]|nr:AI-2E family transporter [Planctomycetota bacterium]
MTNGITPLQRSILVLSGLCIILASLKAASAMLVPLLLSLFIAMACNPLINRLVKIKVPRTVSVFVVITVVVLFGAAFGSLVSSSLAAFKLQMPTYQAQLATQLTGLQPVIEKLGLDLSVSTLKDQINPGVVMGLASDLLSSVGSVLTNTFLILFTVIFMLLESDSVTPKLHTALRDPMMKINRIDTFLNAINQYLSIKTLVSLGTGTLAGLVTHFMGIEHAILWGVTAFLLNYIPNIGSIVAAAPPVLLGWLQGGVTDAGIIAGAYIAINTFMGNVIEPRLMGKGLGLSTLVVFLSLVFWGWLFGTIGMLLSVPLTMMLKTALDAQKETHWIGIILASPDALHQYQSDIAQTQDSNNE